MNACYWSLFFFNRAGLRSLLLPTEKLLKAFGTRISLCEKESLFFLIFL